MSPGTTAAPPRPRGTPLQLLVKPVSGACNLSCDYCFYRGISSSAKGAMAPRTLRLLVRSFLELRQPLSVFSWQGGEPTLAGLDFFREVVRLQIRHGADGQAVGNSLQTNGLLLDSRWAAFLRQYRFLVGLSLDGPEAIHDLHRRDAGGGGSQRKALRAARLLNEQGVPFSVLAVVTRESSGAAVYSWMREQGFDSLQFIPAVENAPGGGMAPYTPDPAAYGEFLCRTFDEWWPERSRVFVREFDALASRLAGGGAQSCQLGESCDSYLVVEADGRLYPCDFFVRPGSCLGELGSRPLPEIMNQPQARAFAGQKAGLAAGCRACEWLPLCRGGCPKDRERAGDVLGPTYLCEGTRLFLSHAASRLRLWALESRASEG